MLAWGVSGTLSTSLTPLPIVMAEWRFNGMHSARDHKTPPPPPPLLLVTPFHRLLPPSL